MGLNSLKSSRANTRGVPVKKQFCLKVVTWKSYPSLQSLSLAYGSDTSFHACMSQVIKISLYTPYQFPLFLCRTLADTSKMSKEMQWSRPYWDSTHWPTPLPGWSSLALSP